MPRQNAGSSITALTFDERVSWQRQVESDNTSGILTKTKMKFVKRYKIALYAVVAALALAYGGFQVSRARTFQFFGVLVPRVNTQEKAVALTFDDGPAPAATEEVLALLREENVKATFFVIGAELERHPGAGRALVAAGHELGNHSYSHKRMVLKTPGFIASEIERTDALIRQTDYQGPIHFRPPYGKRLLLLPYYLAQHQRKTILWDVEPDSYPAINQQADKITEHVLANAKPGSIILMHVMSDQLASRKALRGVVTGLKRAGYAFKTVSELMALP